MDYSSHANSKKVTIFRSGSFMSRAQGADTDEYFSMGKVSVDSYFEKKDSRRVATGLSFEEEELLLPSFVDASPQEREFRKNVSAFYTDISTKIPYPGGITLEIGLSSNNDKPVSKDNMPLDTMDFIRWRHAKGHPFMAASKEEAEGNQMKNIISSIPPLYKLRIRKRT